MDGNKQSATELFTQLYDGQLEFMDAIAFFDIVFFCDSHISKLDISLNKQLQNATLLRVIKNTPNICKTPLKDVRTITGALVSEQSKCYMQITLEADH